MDIQRKKVVVFDLDGTLAETKSPIDAEMSGLLTRLLSKKVVAVIGGGKYDLFKLQLIRQLRAPKMLLQKLFLFPTTATSFYRYGRGWKKIYDHQLSKQEKQSIYKALRETLNDVGYIPPEKTYGRTVEDRGTQITFSTLGQDVVKVLGPRGVELKKQWKEENIKMKMRIVRELQRCLPGLKVSAAGYTSIDITRKGIDKAYGIKQIKRHLHVSTPEMIFIGDALFPGGNDYAVRRTRVKCVPVSGPKQTKQIIRSWLTKL